MRKKNWNQWKRRITCGVAATGLLMSTVQATAAPYAQGQPLELLQVDGVSLVRTGGTGDGWDAPASYPAAILYSYGLLEGAGMPEPGQVSLNVDKPLSRHEGVALLVRLMGKEAEAKTGTWDMPFTDVADWAVPYVGYAYTHGIAAGTSATTFSGTQPMSRSQFLTMTLRALGWSDQAGEFSWSNPDRLAAEEGLLCPMLSETGFYRGDAIFICYEALDARIKGRDCTLLEQLTEQGAIRDRGVPNLYGEVLLTAQADTLEAQLDYLREEFGRSVMVDFSGYGQLTDMTDQLLEYCEARNLEPEMPEYLLYRATEAGVLSYEEREALEEEMLQTLRPYMDFQPEAAVEQYGYSLDAYDREFYLAQAEFLQARTDQLPQECWQIRVMDTPAHVGETSSAGRAAKLYAEKEMYPGLFPLYKYSSNREGWTELGGEGQEGRYLLQAMEELYSFYTELVDEDMSDYEKVKAIYEGVMDRTSYSYEHKDGYNIAVRGAEPLLITSWVGLVEESKMVCSGYADSVAVLLDMAGIPNVQVSGKPESGGAGHAWNKVLLDGVWYNLDATWGDTGSNPAAYFLRSDAAFFQDGHGQYSFDAESRFVYDFPAPRDYQ